MMPSAAESESAGKPPSETKNKKSLMVGDIDLATLEGRPIHASSSPRCQPSWSSQLPSASGQTV
jgi:hypothetical protein